MHDQVTLAAVIIGAAIVFAALLNGYFGVLREWSTTKSTTRAIATRAAISAQESLRYLEDTRTSESGALERKARDSELDESGVGAR